MGLAYISFPIVLCLTAAAAFAAWGFHLALARDRRAPLVLLAAAGLLLTHISLFARFTVDDSFITFRYARNWAAGLGPVYQAGERVEGFTGFLWMALLSLAGKLGLPIERAAKGLGIVCALLTLPAAHRLGSLLRPGTRTGALAALMLALSPVFASWTCAGLETPLFAMLLAWAACAFVAEGEAPGGFPFSALLFGLLVWVRPEGALFAAIALGVRLQSPLPAPARGRDVLRWMLVAGALAVPFWLWRWSYYGQFFPNTFYAKVGIGGGRPVLGLISFSEFLGDCGLFVVLMVVLALARARGRDSRDRFVILSLAAFFAYVIAIGGDILHLRFYVHVLPLWIVLAAIGLDAALDAVQRAGASWLSGVRWMGVAIGLVWATLVVQQDARLMKWKDGYGASYVVDCGEIIERAHIPLGRWLRQNAPSGARVAALDIGAVGYYSQMPLIDLWGLTSRAIADLAHSNRRAEIGEYVLGQHPEFMVLYGSSAGPSVNFLEPYRARIDSAYRVHSFWRDSPADKGLVLMARRDLVLPDASPPGALLAPH